MRKTKVKVIEHKGITLMSLVITVIVLLILAGISIQMISGDNGILKKSRESKGLIDEASALEYIKLSIAAARTVDNNIDKANLENELKKYFQQITVEVNGKNDYMIEADGIIYNIDSNGNLTSGYKKEVSEDGVLVSTGDGNVLNGKIYGNSIQNGTPSPDNPIEIQSVGDLVTEGEYKGKYKIPVTVSGKNLFDTQNWYNWLRTFTTEYVTKTTVDGINCIYYRPSYTFNKPYMSGQFKERTRYTIRYRAKGIVGTGVSTGFKFVYTDGTYELSYVGNKNEWDFYTKVSNGKTIDHIEMTYNYGQGCYIDENSIQLEENVTATDYEPYQAPRITNIYLNEPLRTIGDDADYIDLKNKKVVRKISEKIFDGTEEWTNFTNNNLYQVYTKNTNLNGKQYSSVMSNIVPYGVTVNTRLDYTLGAYLVSGGTDVGVQLYGWKQLSVEEWKTWLNTNNVCINYTLATPTEETIDLPEILTHKGTNIVTVDTEIKPSKTEILYYKLDK